MTMAGRKYLTGRLPSRSWSVCWGYEHYRRYRRRRAFTLAEILISMTVLVILGGVLLSLSVGMSRSLNRGNEVIGRQQSSRLMFSRLGREVSQFAYTPRSQEYFTGEENGFFLSCRVMPARQS